MWGQCYGLLGPSSTSRETALLSWRIPISLLFQNYYFYLDNSTKFCFFFIEKSPTSSSKKSRRFKNLEIKNIKIVNFHSSHERVFSFSVNLFKLSLIQNEVMNWKKLMTKKLYYHPISLGMSPHVYLCSSWDFLQSLCTYNIYQLRWVYMASSFLVENPQTLLLLIASSLVERMAVR